MPDKTSVKEMPASTSKKQLQEPLVKDAKWKNVSFESLPIRTCLEPPHPSQQGKEASPTNQEVTDVTDDKTKPNIQKKINNLDDLELAGQYGSIQRAASALSSMKTFMKNTEKFYKEQHGSLASTVCSPLDLANNTIVTLRQEAARREQMLIELRKHVTLEVLNLKVGGITAADDMKARMATVHKSQEIKLLEMQEEIDSQCYKLKESEAEVMRLKKRLQKDNDRLGEAMSQVEESKMSFNSDIQSIRTLNNSLKAELSQRDSTISKTYAELSDLDHELGWVRAELSKNKEEIVYLKKVQADLKAVITTYETKEQQDMDYENCISSLNDDKSTLQQTIEKCKIETSTLQKKYDKLVDQLDSIVADKAFRAQQAIIIEERKVVAELQRKNRKEEEKSRLTRRIPPKHIDVNRAIMNTPITALATDGCDSDSDVSSVRDLIDERNKTALQKTGSAKRQGLRQSISATQPGAKEKELDKKDKELSVLRNSLMDLEAERATLQLSTINLKKDVSNVRNQAHERERELQKKIDNKDHEFNLQISEYSFKINQIENENGKLKEELKEIKTAQENMLIKRRFSLVEKNVSKPGKAIKPPLVDEATHDSNEIFLLQLKIEELQREIEELKLQVCIAQPSLPSLTSAMTDTNDLLLMLDEESMTEAMYSRSVYVQADVTAETVASFQATNDVQSKALLAVVRRMKGISRKHVPYKDFIHTGHPTHTDNNRLNHSAAVQLRSPKAMYHKRFDMPNDKPPSDKDVKARTKRALTYLEDACKLQSKLKQSSQNSSNGSLKLLIEALGLVLYTTAHFLSPSGKTADVAFPELLASLTDDAIRGDFDDSDYDEDSPHKFFLTESTPLLIASSRGIISRGSTRYVSSSIDTMDSMAAEVDSTTSSYRYSLYGEVMHGALRDGNMAVLPLDNNTLTVTKVAMNNMREYMGELVVAAPINERSISPKHKTRTLYNETQKLGIETALSQRPAVTMMGDSVRERDNWCSAQSQTSPGPKPPNQPASSSTRLRNVTFARSSATETQTHTKDLLEPCEDFTDRDSRPYSSGGGKNRWIEMNVRTTSAPICTGRSNSPRKGLTGLIPTGISTEPSPSSLQLHVRPILRAPTAVLELEYPCLEDWMREQPLQAPVPRDAASLRLSTVDSSGSQGLDLAGQGVKYRSVKESVTGSILYM